MANDIITMNKEEFEKVVDEITELRAENKELKKALDFLNKQIEEYNEEFVKAGKR